MAALQAADPKPGIRGLCDFTEQFDRNLQHPAIKVRRR